MFIHRLKVSGLLSFGPIGIDLPLQPLHVLIGANGSGQSNLLDVLNLWRVTARRLSQPQMRDPRTDPALHWLQDRYAAIPDIGIGCLRPLCVRHRKSMDSMD